jgi:VanZ family protein
LNFSANVYHRREESMDEEATGNNESADKHIDLWPTNSLLINSLLRYWLPPVLWMSVIFILSAQPTLPHYPEALLDLVLKKAGHMIEYGILAFLLWRALSRGRVSWLALVTTFVVSVLYAASDEYHQTFVPGRNGTPVDVGIDAVGALVALLIVRSLGRKGRRR